MSNKYGFLINAAGGRNVIDTTLHRNITLLDVLYFDAEYWSTFNANTLALKYKNGSTPLPTTGNLFVVQPSELNTLPIWKDKMAEWFLSNDDPTIIKKTYNMSELTGTDASFNYSDVFIRVSPVNRALLNYTIKDNILTVYIAAEILTTSVTFDYGILFMYTPPFTPEELVNFKALGKTITLRIGLS